MRREAERLQDILDAIAAIERYASLGRQAFDNQELIQIWIVHHLQIIGEATNALSSELTGVHVGMQIEPYDPRHLDVVIRLSHGGENLWIWKNYFKPEI